MEIEREENIFYNLIKNETSLTEVFCNFMRYENFRNLFIDIINEKIKNQENIIDKSIVKFQNFDTEVALNDKDEKAGRIDLQLKINENEKYLFEIKIETFTSLTKHQPESYLKFLDNKDENLFFILPKGYFHKSEIFKRWEEKTKYSKKEIENHNIIYWEDILKELRKEELYKENIFIDEFCNILDFRWFYFEKIEFTKNEIELIFSDKKEKGYKMLENVSIPVLMNKLFQVVVDTANKINNTQKRRDEQNSMFYGYYLNNSNLISNKLDIWFGVDYELWEKTKLPLSIQILTITQEDKDNKNIEKFLNNKKINGISFQKIEDKNQNIIFYILLEKEVFEQEDKNIIKELTHKINEVINLLKEYK